jgi:hypothetical protein
MTHTLSPCLAIDATPASGVSTTTIWATFRCDQASEHRDLRRSVWRVADRSRRCPSTSVQQGSPIHDQLYRGRPGIVGANGGEEPPTIDGRSVGICRWRDQRRRLDEPAGVEQLARKAEPDVRVCPVERSARVAALQNGRRTPDGVRRHDQCRIPMSRRSTRTTVPSPRCVERTGGSCRRQSASSRRRRATSARLPGWSSFRDNATAVNGSINTGTIDARCQPVVSGAPSCCIIPRSSRFVKGSLILPFRTRHQWMC